MLKCQHFNIYKQDKFHAQLKLSMIFYNLWARCVWYTLSFEHHNKCFYEEIKKKSISKLGLEILLESDIENVAELIRGTSRSFYL